MLVHALAAETTWVSRAHLACAFGGTEQQAVVTSYRCEGLYVDSTGRQPSRTPDLVVANGTPLRFWLGAERQPVEEEERRKLLLDPPLHTAFLIIKPVECRSWGLTEALHIALGSDGTS